MKCAKESGREQEGSDEDDTGQGVDWDYMEGDTKRVDWVWKKNRERSSLGEEMTVKKRKLKETGSILRLRLKDSTTR